MALKYLPQSENLLQGTISESIDASQIQFDVSDPPQSDRLPTYFELDPMTDDAERVRVVGVTGDTVTVERGVNNGGVGLPHNNNAPYKQTFPTESWQAVVDALQNGYLTEDTVYTFTRLSTTQFRVDGIDRTDFYATGRRVRINTTYYVTVESSLFTGGNTVVTVSGDVLPSTVSSIELAIEPYDFALPQKIITDTVTEKTAGVGVTADGVLLKDSVIQKDAYPELRAKAQGTQDLTLAVAAGKVIISQTLVVYAGGNSPSVTPPSVNPRIDILTINSSGTLEWTTGAEGASPSLPTIPTGKTPICAIYNTVAETSIKNTDDSTNGYILHDLRKLVSDVPAVPDTSILTTTHYAPQGFLINGKISVTVNSNNLTVAIKGLDGNDPSASNPVYCRIGDTVVTLTAALSVTKNAGTNWCNSGSAELATKEIDYFVYLIRKAADGNVLIGFSRVPYNGADWNNSSSGIGDTGDSVVLYGGVGDPGGTDYLECVGRFAATLSAGAGYAWSVPTSTAANLIQRPIHETRLLVWVPVGSSSGGTPPTYTATFSNYYKIIGRTLSFWSTWENSAGGTAGNGTDTLKFTLPHNNSLFVGNRSMVGTGVIYESGGTIGPIFVLNSDTSRNVYFATSAFAAIVANDQSSTSRICILSGRYNI